MNEFRLSEENGKDGMEYTVNEKIGRTDANLYGVNYNVLNVLDKIVAYNSKYFSLADEMDEDGDLTLPFMYHAKSKTNLTHGDVFNSEIGRIKAHDRCMAKYHKGFDTKIRLALKDIRTLVGAIEYYCDKTGIDISSVSSIEDIRKKRFGE